MNSREEGKPDADGTDGEEDGLAKAGEKLMAEFYLMHTPRFVHTHNKDKTTSTIPHPNTIH